MSTTESEASIPKKDVCRACKGTCYVPLSDDPAVIGIRPCSFCRGLGVTMEPNLNLKDRGGRVDKALAKEHWAVRNPGLADQYRNETQACRKLLGFEHDALDVSPSDLMDAIEALKGNHSESELLPYVEDLEHNVEQMSLLLMGVLAEKTTTGNVSSTIEDIRKYYEHLESGTIKK